MNELILKQEIINYYPQIKFSHIHKLSNRGIMNNIFIIENGIKFIVKIYNSKNIKKILSEHEVVNLIKNKIFKTVFYIKNKHGLTYTISHKLNYCFAIYKYKNGICGTSSPSHIKNLAILLAKFHKISKNLEVGKDVLCRNVKSEFYNNIYKLKMALLTINNKKKLNKKEIFIKHLIQKKLESVSRYNFKKDIKTISYSSKGIIHGDFAPNNLLFQKNKISGILDWENTCEYNYIWEIFRSICHSSKIGETGLICSKLDKKKVDLFLKSYFREIALDMNDIEAIKLMPKYYYFLDSYIITSYCLQGNKKVGDLISTKIDDHFWLENYQEKFINLVNKYAKRKK